MLRPEMAKDRAPLPHMLPHQMTSTTFLPLIPVPAKAESSLNYRSTARSSEEPQTSLPVTTSCPTFTLYGAL